MDQGAHYIAAAGAPPMIEGGVEPPRAADPQKTGPRSGAIPANTPECTQLHTHVQGPG